MSILTCFHCLNTHAAQEGPCLFGIPRNHRGFRCSKNEHDSVKSSRNAMLGWRRGFCQGRVAMGFSSSGKDQNRNGNFMKKDVGSNLRRQQTDSFHHKKSWQQWINVGEIDGYHGAFAPSRSFKGRNSWRKNHPRFKKRSSAPHIP